MKKTLQNSSPNVIKISSFWFMKKHQLNTIHFDAENKVKEIHPKFIHPEFTPL